MGAVESSSGATIKDIPLSFSEAFAASGSTSMKLTRIKDVPKGVRRRLLYIDLLMEASFTTAGGGALAARAPWNLVSNMVLNTAMGSTYSNVSGRQVRQAYRHRAGKRAQADPAAIGAGAGPIVQRNVCRIMFADPGATCGKGGSKDRSISSELLYDDFALTFATAAIGTNLTINSATFRAIARVEDSFKERTARPWQIQGIPFSTVDITLPPGDHFLAFLDNAAESWTEALLLEIFVPNYGKFPLHHQAQVSRWNAEYAASAADEMVPEGAAGAAAVDHFPLWMTPGYVGQQSEADTHGGAEAVHARITGGSTTSGTVIDGWFSPTTVEQRGTVLKMAFPERDIAPGGAFAVVADTRDGDHVDLDSRKALSMAWEVKERVTAEQAVALKQAMAKK